MKKAQRIKSHKIFVLMAMLSEELDDVEMLSENANAINKLSKELILKIDPYIDKIFKNVPVVNKTTYIQDMQNKVDTVIRKNYKDTLS